MANRNTPEGGWDGPLGIQLKARQRAIGGLGAAIVRHTPHQTGTLASATRILDQTPMAERGATAGVFLFTLRVLNKLPYALPVHEGVNRPAGAKWGRGYLKKPLLIAARRFVEAGVQDWLPMIGVEWSEAR